jgi:2-oxoglutarate ferredoxin oxidoreductase subunit alpha
LHAGYEVGEIGFHVDTPQQKTDMKLLNGNHALALGALHGGVQFYAGYPMSPSSSILGYMAQFGPKAGVVVRQVEDEITAAQMVLGACAAGTRSLTATSGGGFDLMTETLSLAGILEVPFVSIIAQRPGPATGLPTWTAQGDLDLAIHAGHGEFPRIVIGVSNPTDAFRLIQEALNNAEKYQVPVIVLIDKVICESNMTIPALEQNTIPIERWLVEEKDFEKIQSSDRYKITESGVSLRWNPGDCDAYYFANGDEHWEMGELEEGERAGEMYEKRMRKLETIKKDLPAPRVFGPQTADISFVGWGSSLSIMHDIIQLYESRDMSVNYLHYEYVWPLNRESAHDFFENNNNVHLIENNYTGQFGNKLEFHTESRFKGRLLKWNGRPFFIEDVETYIQTHI